MTSSVIWTAVLITLCSVIIFVFMRAGRQQQQKYRKLRKRVRNKALYGWDSAEAIGEESQAAEEATDGSLEGSDPEQEKP